jgi:hypothetical protein
VIKSKNYFLLLITQIFILLGLSACGVKDTYIDNPLVGKTIEIKSSLYILNGLGNGMSFTDSPTALKLGSVSLTVDSLTSCIGCNFKDFNMQEFLPSHANIKIIKAYRSDPPFFYIDASRMDYFIAQTENGIKFTIPTYELDEIIKENLNNNEDGERREKLLNSFADKNEKKSFYFSPQDSYTKSLFPTKKPPFSSEDVKNTFKEVFADIGHFNITDINTNTGQLAFSVTTDREGLAYLILKTSEKYVDISLYQKMN